MSRTGRGAVLLAGLAGLAAGCTGAGSGGTGGVRPDSAVTAGGPPSAQVARLDGDPSLHFRPNVVLARVGQLTLSLGAIGGTPHNLTFTDPALPAIGIVGTGVTKSATYTFTRPGRYDFRCTIHAGMTGRVVVS